MVLKDIFLTVSGVLEIVCIYPYIRDILKRTTKPNITTWLTWTILSTIASFALVAAGENRSAFFSGMLALQTGSVVVLGLKFGYAKYSTFDYVCQVGAVIGLLLWWIFNSPSLAIYAAVIIDFIGALPTVRHSILKPQEETASSYTLSALSALLAIFALTEYNLNSLVYALYILVIDGTIATILIIKQRKLTWKMP